MPPNIADVLTLLHILLVYARHLALTLDRRDADDVPDPDNLPTLKQLVEQIRRRPIGQTIADICRDLGVAPRLCDMRFWNALSDVLNWYRGNPPGLLQDLHRRQRAFEPEWDRNFDLAIPDHSREGSHRMLGFFIGAQWPVMPLPPSAPPGPHAAAATGPP